LISSYGTNLVVPAMPVAIQHNRLFFGLFALAANQIRIFQAWAG
jgi:branched-chain amino acid transport system substrate-binding protein